MACDYFTTSLVKVRESAELPAWAGQFAVVIRGKGSVAGESARPGDAWFADSVSLKVEGEVDLLVAH